MSDTGPYRHVADLPAFVAMVDELRWLRRANVLVTPDARAREAALQRRILALVRRANGFAERLGPRGWSFSDVLDPAVIDAVLAAESVDDAEDVLVAHLSDTAVIDAYLRDHHAVLGAVAVSDDPVATAKAWCHLFAVATRS